MAIDFSRIGAQNAGEIIAALLADGFSWLWHSCRPESMSAMPPAVLDWTICEWRAPLALAG